MIERIVANGHGKLINPKFFAIHSTANPGVTAANHVQYWRNNQTYAVHLVSDWKEAYHTVPFDRLCYQVGNGNSTCIGMEICEATTEADFMRGMEVARDTIWEVLNIMGWGVDRLRSHDWFRRVYGGTDHTDPIPYLKKFGKNWDWFIQFVSQKSEKKEPPLPLLVPGGSIVYRLYNPNSNKHHFTTSKGERDALIKSGWKSEGEGWKSPDMIPVMQLYNPNDGDHIHTTSINERDTLIKSGWVYEGISTFSVPDGIPVYRLYDKRGGHMYTTSASEKDQLAKAGWNNEGIAFQAAKK